jgi:hypothetical protein
MKKGPVVLISRHSPACIAGCYLLALITGEPAHAFNPKQINEDWRSQSQNLYSHALGRFNTQLRPKDPVENLVVQNSTLAPTKFLAQTQVAATGNAQFDGLYTFVSATKLNETYTTTATAHLRQCPNWGGPGRLLIVNGHAQYPYGKPTIYEGTVGPQGELMMRSNSTPVVRGESPGVERTIMGIIDNSGTVNARMTAYYCGFDLVWRKERKEAQ